MRVSRAIVVFTGVLIGAAGCGGDDPGSGNEAGNGGRGDENDGGSGRAGTGGAGRAGMDAPLDDGGISAGADGGGMAGSDALPPGEGSFFPLETGNRWTFRVTDSGGVSMKTQTIGPLEEVGGTGPNSDAMAYRATTMKADGGDMTISWQAEVDGKIVRYREQSFMASGGALDLEEHWDPYKLRVDMNEEHLTQGATWTETVMETKLPVGMSPTTATVSDMWRVVAVDEEVTVPAGAFHALVLEKTGLASVKRYWFVRNVGKVKETGTQTEELASYDVME